LADRHASLLQADDAVESEPHMFFDRVVEIDLTTLEPHVAGPHSPDRARPISRFVQEARDPRNGFVDVISTAMIGSCTNASYTGMSRAADVASQAQEHGLRAATALLVTPGSAQIRSTLERDGQLGRLRAIGGVTLANACGPCIGQWQRGAEPGATD